MSSSVCFKGGSAGKILCGMSVLVGVYDQAGRVVIAADTCLYDEDTGAREIGKLKTVRVNRECAVGFSGLTRHGFPIVQEFFDLDLPLDTDVMQHIEDQRVTIARQVPALIGRLDEVVKGYADSQGGSTPEVSVLLVGQNDTHSFLVSWAQDNEMEIDNKTQPRRNSEYRFTGFSPGAKAELECIMKDGRIYIDTRIKKACGLCASRFPKEVDAVITWRDALAYFGKSTRMAILPSTPEAPTPST